MAKISRPTIEGMATLAGWGSYAKDASWVAMAESGGDPNIVNSIGCVGLMQINQPVHVKSHPQWTVAWLKNPINNLKAGLVLFEGSGKKFDGPWLDSKDKGGIPGGWGPHVSGKSSSGSISASDVADAAVAGVTTAVAGPVAGALTTVSDVPASIISLGQATVTAAHWISDPTNWIRVLYVIGGAVLVIGGVVIVARPLINNAVSMTPVGGAVKNLTKGSAP